MSRTLFRVALASFFVITSAYAQSLGNAGTIDGTVVDPSGSVITNAEIEISNPISGYTRKTTTDANGVFRFTSIPRNSYHLQITAPGFTNYQQDVQIRSAVPLPVRAQLTIAGSQASVTVQGESADLIENVPYAHNDMDRSMYDKLPTTTPGSGLSDAITMGTPGVVADSNGFFHPLGDHAQVTFSIDGQPISDQQSKQFSTQIPLNAIQSMELITGAPNAEFGDKTSLVVSAVTRSGLGLKEPTGSLMFQYGSFGMVGEEATLGFGGAKAGNFLTINSTRSGRFLDTPEFFPNHDIGNNLTVFDRIDFQPKAKDAFHLNLFGARNWFQIPNTYDQPHQDQRQKVSTFSFAPGYQRTINAHTLLTINPFIRQDRVNYYGSRDPFDDSPATLNQQRRLTNYGIRADLSYVKGHHNLKFGTQVTQTRLREDFNLGLTDPAFNAVCVSSAGEPEALPNVTDPAGCAPLGYTANPDLVPGLVGYDLTRGGKLLHFAGAANINQGAVFVQDTATYGSLSLNGGLRIDRYDGISTGTGVQPRIGVAYQLKPTGTVLRAAYSRTFETPYNENLIVSSQTGAGGLGSGVVGGFGSSPLKPGTRNQFNVGAQQAFDKVLMVDADYFWKFTDNAFDFDTLFNTPILFPIQWRKSKIDGVSLRLSTPTLHGIQAYTTLGHTRARFFGPENGGLLFNSPLNTSVFRIDHDQALQQTTNVRYQMPKSGPWISFTWRFDSGLVAGAVPDLASALALTGAQQAAIGLSCGAQVPTVDSPITSCAPSSFNISRLRLPKEGTENDDHNPPRVAPRNLFDVAVGTDNLFHTDRYHTKLRFTVMNLANNVALYNFLSTFSGTHFVAPRSYQAEIGFSF